MARKLRIFRHVNLWSGKDGLLSRELILVIDDQLCELVRFQEDSACSSITTATINSGLVSRGAALSVELIVFHLSFGLENNDATRAAICSKATLSFDSNSLVHNIAKDFVLGLDVDVAA